MGRFTKVLLTGANGQLAGSLKRSAPADCEVIALSRQELNIADAEAIQRALKTYKPDCVINGAAFNQVDNAETKSTFTAFEVNAIGVAFLARSCKEQQIPLVHFSTDFVFDGQKKSPYTEDDKTRPLSIYGASKLAGENVALSTSAQNYVIRVSRLFGPVKAAANSAGQKSGGNFVLTMLALAAKHKQIKVVSDQIGSPSYTEDQAPAVWELLRKSSGGLYHLSNSGEVAFDEYARTIFKLADIDCEVIGISSAEYGAPAKRPLYSTLSNAKVQKLGIKPLRNWREALASYLQTIDKLEN